MLNLLCGNISLGLVDVLQPAFPTLQILQQLQVPAAKLTDTCVARLLLAAHYT
jgi:hypothetical protein